MRLRTIIVDDEPPARALVRRYLSRDPAVEVLAECEDAAQAVQEICRRSPDLIVLDVDLGGATGFDVLADLGETFDGAVVFVTAYDRYAVAAFERHAVDYLLKPLEPERLQTALNRVRERLSTARLRRGCLNADPSGPWRATLETLAGSQRWDRYPLREGNVTVYVRPAEIERLEADGNYVQVYARGRAHLVRESLRAFEAKWGQPFLRTSRSTLVNLHLVRELRALPNGTATLVLASGARADVSRSHRTLVEATLANRSGS